MPAMNATRKILILAILLMLSPFCWAQQFEGDWNVRDFTFKSGEKLPELRLHYITLGSPERDAAGHVRNAVLILHGTGGIGRNFLSVEFAGRNRMTRTMAVQAIKNDPDWKNGEYTSQPRGLMAARNIRSIMTGSALQFQKENPTAEKADTAVEAMGKAALRGDANDTIYQYEASTDYNPSPTLDKIQAPLFAINSADDEINPPELGILDREIKHVKLGRYILIPLSDETRGHQTYNRAALWKNHLLELLHISEPGGRAALRH